jgi:hypothetical protein
MSDIRPRSCGIDLRVERLDIRRSAAAIAGDRRGTPLDDVVDTSPQVRGNHLVIAVRVQVDEAGGDTQSRAIDDAIHLTDLELADRHDHFVANGHVTRQTGRAIAKV